MLLIVPEGEMRVEHKVNGKGCTLDCNSAKALEGVAITMSGLSERRALTNHTL